jgi:hypothetical protein
MTAEVRSIYIIWCDGPDCRSRVSSSQSRAAARRGAVRLGWRVNVDKTSRSGGSDYCAAHHERDPEE